MNIEHWWNDSDGSKPKYLEKSVPVALCPHPLVNFAIIEQNRWLQYASWQTEFEGFWNDLFLPFFYPNKCETEQRDLKAMGHVTFNTFTSVIAVQPAGSTSCVMTGLCNYVSRDF